MDEYYLAREDIDTIMEVGVGERREAVVTKEISGATKTALTKKYVFVVVNPDYLCSSADGRAAGITPESIRYRSIKLRIWVKCRKSLRVNQRLISKRLSMCVCHSFL